MEECYQLGIEEPALEKAAAASARDLSFAALVERRSRFVFQVVYAVLRHPQDSEDVVQDIFFQLYRTGAWERVTN